MTRNVLVAAVCVLAFMSPLGAQYTPPPKNNPKVVTPVVWNRAVTMPDGRMFVTDGGFMIDAKIAKPDKMPALVLPVENGKIIESRVKGPFHGLHSRVLPHW